MIKVIAFDFGGVLFRNDWPKTLEALGLREAVYEEFSRVLNTRFKLGKMSETEFWSLFVANPENKKEVSKLGNRYRKMVELNDGVFSVIKRAAGECRLFSLNNEPKEWMEFRIKKFGLEKYFEAFVCSGFERTAKPDQEIYETLLKRAAVEPPEVLFIDDKEKNLEPAKRLGIQTICFKNGSQLESKMRELGLLVKA